MESAGELLQRHAARAARGPEPAEHELSADRVVADLFGRQLLERLARRGRRLSK